MNKLKHTVCISTLIFIFTNIHAVSAKETLRNNFLKIELAAKLNIGVYAIDTVSGQTIAYHATKRFPMCSTSKLMTVAAILKKSTEQPGFMKKQIHYTTGTVISSGYAPITQQHIDSGMTIEQLCQASIMYSDNAANNLLTKALGGIAKVNQFAASIRDKSFQLSRYEPQLNSAKPKDIRDTSTPKSMALSMQRLLLGDILPIRQRQLLTQWLVNNTTGADRIRAGVPSDWKVADKTGTGRYGTTNDIAVIWPPKQNPIIMAIFLRQANENAKPRSDIIADIAHIIIDYYESSIR